MLITDLRKICLRPLEYFDSLLRSKSPPPPVVCSIRDHSDMPFLRMILPNPSPSKEPHQVFTEIFFQDELMMRNALTAVPLPHLEDVPIFLEVPIAESPTWTRSSFSSSTSTSPSRPSSPWMDIKFETGVLVANNLEEQRRQNRKLTMGLLTGQVETRERRLKWAETLEVLESKRDPEPMSDWDWQCGLAPAFNDLEKLRRKHWQWEAELSAMYERRILPPRRKILSRRGAHMPESSCTSTQKLYGSEFLKRTLLSSLSPCSQAHLAGWTPDCTVYLLRLAYDGPLYDRVTRIRNLDACSIREYREEMAEVADRNWYDTIVVLRPGEELPSTLRFARIKAHVVMEWGADML